MGDRTKGACAVLTALLCVACGRADLPEDPFDRCVMLSDCSADEPERIDADGPGFELWCDEHDRLRWIWCSADGLEWSLISEAKYEVFGGRDE